MRKKWLCILLFLCMIVVCNLVVQAGTPEIIIDGVVVQEKQTPKILEACEKLQAQLMSDISNGVRWEYHNGGKQCDEQWNEALAYGKHGCNCALLARWAIREAGIVGQYEGGFYGKKGGSIAWSEKSKALLLSKFDDIVIGGTKTVNELMNGGYLQPGDILTYVNMNHTNIYAGNSMWYDGGHAYCTGSGEGAVFNSWYGTTVHGSQPVGHILRYREDSITVTDTTPDIVITEADDMTAVKSRMQMQIINWMQYLPEMASVLGVYIVSII